jgi:hypothetical protein
MKKNVQNNVVVGIDDVHAVAMGVDKQSETVRKSRVRKAGGVARVPATKKPKAVKVPRNPFRRSDTGKLSLKRLQMSKRLETMGPRVTALRERLDSMQERYEFVSGKFKLVCEELVSRESVGDAAGVTESVDTADKDEDIELDDEVEEDEVENDEIDNDDEAVAV